MTIQLTQLEADVLTMIAAAACTRSELVQFVSTHHETTGQDPETISHALLANWARRRWLESREMNDETHLHLTMKARHDVPWLPLPGSGPLQRVRQVTRDIRAK